QCGIYTPSGVAADLIIWGFQVEEAERATSEILTDGGTMTHMQTRLVDTFTLTDTFDSQEFTHYARWYDPATGVADDEISVQTDTAPPALTTERAYTHIFGVAGSHDLEAMQT